MPVWMKPFGARGLSAGTAGEFSLALGHREIYDTILRERLACALVFENDVLLAPGFVRRLGRVALPDGLDVLKLETCNLAAPFRMTRRQAGAGQCPMPQCPNAPMPHAPMPQCPMPNGPYPTPNVQCSMPQ